LGVNSVGGLRFEVTSVPSVQQRVSTESDGIRVSLVDVVSMDESVVSPGLAIGSGEVVNGRIGLSITIAVYVAIVIIVRLNAGFFEDLLVKVPLNEIRRDIVSQLVKIVGESSKNFVLTREEKVEVCRGINTDSAAFEDLDEV
jgi:hypothetical protein